LDPRKRVKEQMEREKEERMKRQRREESQCQTLADWIALEKSRGYKAGWAYRRFSERQKRRQARAGPVLRSYV
jgi:hypothetical protein